MNPVRASAVRITLLALMPLLAGTAWGQAAYPAAYPSKPIRLILPYAPGGSTSVLGRMIGQKLTESWHQPVLVDNRPGGGTAVGSEIMVKSPPDGHTILLVTSTHTINPSLRAVPFNAVKDFAPVATLTRAPFLLAIHPALPARSLKEFIALAKSRPGQLDYSSSGAGTSNHLCVELFAMAAGIKLHHVPYKGGGPAIVDLLGGQVQLHMNSPVNLIPNIQAGRLRGIAVTGETRVAALPEIPTFNDAGVRGLNIVNWFGILAPAETPKPIVDKLSAEIGKILQMPDIREKLLAQGSDPWYAGPDQFAALIRSELDTYAKVIKAAAIKID